MKINTMRDLKYVEAITSTQDVQHMKNLMKNVMDTDMSFKWLRNNHFSLEWIRENNFVVALNEHTVERKLVLIESVKGFLGENSCYAIRTDGYTEDFFVARKPLRDEKGAIVYNEDHEIVWVDDKKYPYVHAYKVPITIEALNELHSPGVLLAENYVLLPSKKSFALLAHDAGFFSTLEYDILAGPRLFVEKVIGQKIEEYWEHYEKEVLPIACKEYPYELAHFEQLMRRYRYL